MNWTLDELQAALKNNPALHVNEKDLDKLQEAGGKKHKYNAEPGYLDGIYFDSQAEMRRYGELLMLKLAKIVKEFKVHPRYRVSANKFYEADFEVTYQDGHTEVEDVKGVMTPRSALAIDLFKEKYPEYIFKLIR